jgi:hypothetical protein
LGTGKLNICQSYKEKIWTQKMQDIT